jgi:hypothetical protein
MPEHDLIWMSLLIFTPTLFALVLLFMPRGTPDEWMRWGSLFGTALTLGISLAVFFEFKNNVIDRYGANSPQGSLEARHDHELNRQRPDKDQPRLSDDWIARYPWIEKFC